MKNKNDLIGKKIKDSVVFDYDDKGLFVKDKYGVKKYFKEHSKEAKNQYEFEKVE